MSRAINKHHRCLLPLSALVLILVWVSAGAASQRMFIPPQSFTISRSGTASVQSMCLDYGIATPEDTISFSPASPTLTNIRVSVPGRGEMSLPDAIAAKVVAVSGTGDARHLRFRNLLPTTDISVTVASPSLMLPDDNRRSDDLAYLFHNPNSTKSLDQLDLWKVRAAPAMAQLGMKPTEIPRGYPFNPNWMIGTQEWVRKSMVSHPQKGQFVLQRVLPVDATGPELQLVDDSQPLYILYPGNAPPQIYKGNSDLLKASAAIKTLWSGAGGSPPPRIVMMGDGEINDFDAARLTLEAAAGGGGRGNLTGPGKPIAFSFDPPDGPRPPGDDPIYEGGSWASIAVDRRADDSYSATHSFYRRGVIKVFAKTLNLVCRMAAAVRSLQPLIPADAPRKDVVAVLRVAIAQEVMTARKQDSALASLEGDAPSAEFDIDGKTTRQVFRQVFTDEMKLRAAELVARR
jgi:hypothetical protein